MVPTIKAGGNKIKPREKRTVKLTQNNVIKIVGNRLRRLREARGLTRDAMSKMCDNVPAQTIVMVELGKRSVDLILLWKMCHALNEQPVVIVADEYWLEVKM